MIEYAILVALIGVIAIGAIQRTGETAADKLCNVAGYINDEPVELVFSVSDSCCGYTPPGLGGSFTCVE